MRCARQAVDRQVKSSPADLAFDLSLVFHELATNSAKYGALSTPDAKAAVTWRIDRDGDAAKLHFVWRDEAIVRASGGRGTGLGSKLISLLIERKWGGSYSIEETPGYRFSCTIPLPRRKRSSDRYPARGPSILIFDFRRPAARTALSSFA